MHECDGRLRSLSNQFSCQSHQRIDVSPDPEVQVLPDVKLEPIPDREVYPGGGLGLELLQIVASCRRRRSSLKTHLRRIRFFVLYRQALHDSMGIEKRKRRGQVKKLVADGRIVSIPCLGWTFALLWRRKHRRHVLQIRTGRVRLEQLLLLNVRPRLRIQEFGVRKRQETTHLRLIHPREPPLDLLQRQVPILQSADQREPIQMVPGVETRGSGSSRRRQQSLGDVVPNRPHRHSSGVHELCQAQALITG